MQTRDRAPEVLEAATCLSWDGLGRWEEDVGAMGRISLQNKMTQRTNPSNPEERKGYGAEERKEEKPPEEEFNTDHKCP